MPRTTSGMFAFGAMAERQCLTCREGPRKLFSVSVRLGSCIFQTRSQPGPKNSSNSGGCCRSTAWTTRLLVMLLVQPSRRADRLMLGRPQQEPCWCGSAVLGSSDGNMNVYRANLCLTKSVCTLGISSCFFSGGDLSPARCQCSLFAVPLEQYQLALAKSPDTQKSV